jgi:hypothetical protein
VSGLKLKYVPVFPGQVIGGAGLDVEKHNGNWTISLDYGEFGLNSPYVPQPSHRVVLFTEDSNGYIAVPVTELALIDTSPPTTPASLAATAIGSSEIDLSWTASTDNIAVTNYLVEQCSGVGCSSFTQIGTTTGTTFANTGLIASMSYSYRVRATDAAGNFSGYSNTATAVTLTAAGDPFFSSVKLLMGFEGVNGATGAPGMTDESSAAHGTATVANTAQISTAQAKYGSSSLFTDTSGSSAIGFAHSSDFLFGSGNFTIEGSFYWNHDTATVQSLMSVWALATGQLSWIVCIYDQGSGTKLNWFTTTDGSTVHNDMIGTTTVSQNQWYTWAVDFDGSKYRLYLNGTMEASFSTLRTLFASTNTLNISNVAGGGYWFMGYQDETRITKGVARYASDSGYTVPTAAFPRH